MRKLAIFFSLLTIAIGAAESQQLTVVSAASPNIGVSADGLAAVFGPNISTQTVAATTVPWPTSLGDISVVYVKDTAGQQFMAGILFVSPTQMNIYIPAGVAPGPATVLFPTTGLPPGVGAAALRNVPVNILNAAPALFSATGTGSGVAAATAVRIVIPTQIQGTVPVFTCSAPATCAAVPIDVGIDAPVYLSLFGTGIRNAGPVTVNIGNTAVQATYAGPQGQYPGLDQVNVPLPLSLRGSGLVNVTLTARGVTSNAVQLSIQ